MFGNLFIYFLFIQKERKIHYFSEVLNFRSLKSIQPAMCNVFCRGDTQLTKHFEPLRFFRKLHFISFEKSVNYAIPIRVLERLICHIQVFSDVKKRDSRQLRSNISLSQAFGYDSFLNYQINKKKQLLFLPKRRVNLNMHFVGQKIISVWSWPQKLPCNCLRV